MPEFTITIHVTDEFILDIMTTMVESSYEWFAFRSVQRADDLSVTSFEVCDAEELASTGYDAGFPWETVTTLSVIETIREFLEKRPVNDTLMGYMDRAVAECDAGEVDSDLADCLLQWTVFGDVIYS